MVMMSSRIVLLLLWLLSTSTIFLLLLCDGINGDDVVVCGEKERAALLSFKQGLKDPSNRLSSWSSLPQLNDCCTWTGVRCNNLTGRVIELHLSNPYSHSPFFDTEDEYESYTTHLLGGNITPSLLELEYLTYLDLSGNYFTTIPTFLGSMPTLTYLNLSYYVFDRSIPHQLGNLSTLRVLDLSHNYISLDNLSWIAHLHSLEYLDMSWIDLHNATDWHQAVSMLPSLSELLLFYCNLQGLIPHQLGNLSTLHHLDLSYNNLQGLIPHQLGNLSTLHHLDLSHNNLQGLIPHQLGNLSTLHHLDLGNYLYVHDLGNNLYVDDFSWIAGLHFLEYLDMTSVDLHKAVDSLQVVSMLPSLSKLLLSDCNLQGLIPHQLGNLSTLHHLDLRYNNLEGLIPHQLGNLSTLHHLDLGNYLYVHDLGNNLYVDDFSWIAGLHFLEYLDMISVDLHMAVDWLQAVSMLPSLSELHLPHCKLAIMIPPLLANVNFTSLAVLDLSINNFKCHISDLLFNLTSSSLLSLDLSTNSLYGHIPGSISNLHLLHNLDLGYNPQITGQIPDGIRQLKHLESLSLAGNSLYGPIPPSIGKLSSLRLLDLSSNQLNGTLPESMGFLSNLESLDVQYNSLEGIVSEVHFATLSKLNTLSLSSNSLFFNVSSNWVPPFQLDFLWMSSCKKIGPRFPSWLPTQTFLTALDISHSGILGAAPEWLWKWVSRFEYINLSDNQINGDISTILLSSSFIDLSSNHFEGQLPHLSPNVQALNLANNSFFGLIPFLCQEINGKSNLEFLDLSNNLLSGGLSDCWIQWQSLTNVNLGSNHLSGKIPNSIGSLTELQVLQLHNNFLREIPLSLQNCTYLRFINLGGNEFTGLIPSWIGEMLNLEILCFRSNKFISNIPSQICQLSELIILDLGNNNLSGPIPKCLKNISAMTITSSSYRYEFGIGVGFGNMISESYINMISLVTKGRESEYKNFLGLVRSIDLSGNNLSGSFPDEFSSLDGLQFLNLSHNQITGTIPKNIGGMTMLESFDLSRNHILGEIPQSMSNLTFLSYLNLSYNNFSGRIPLGTQLQSFNATSYIGNAELCGAPLNYNCTREEESQGRGVTSMEKEEEEYEMAWFYIGMGPGFAVGFWVVCGPLLLKRTWRHAYFQLLDNVKYSIYLAIVLKVNWLRRKIKRCNDA